MTTARNVPPLALNIDGVLRSVPIGRTKLYELFATGELPSFMIGNRRMVRVVDLEAYLAAQVQAAS